jgi:hypothetical protein
MRQRRDRRTIEHQISLAIWLLRGPASKDRHDFRLQETRFAVFPASIVSVIASPSQLAQIVWDIAKLPDDLCIAELARGGIATAAEC